MRYTVGVLWITVIVLGISRGQQIDIIRFGINGGVANGHNPLTGIYIFNAIEVTALSRYMV